MNTISWLIQNFSLETVCQNILTHHIVSNLICGERNFSDLVLTHVKLFHSQKSLFIAHHITLTYAFDDSTNITPVFHKIIMITVISIIKRKNITTPIRIIFLRCSRNHIFLLAFDVITANWLAWNNFFSVSNLNDQLVAHLWTTVFIYDINHVFYWCIMSKCI